MSFSATEEMKRTRSNTRNQYIQWLINVKFSHYPVPHCIKMCDCGVIWCTVCCTIHIIVIISATSGTGRYLTVTSTGLPSSTEKNVSTVVLSVNQSICHSCHSFCYFQRILKTASCYCWEADAELQQYIALVLSLVQNAYCIFPSYKL